MAPGGEFPAWACRMGRRCGQGQPELREGRPPSLQGTSQWVLRSETHWNGLPARGWSVSYPSLRRFVVKRNWRNVGWTTVRTEDTPPGDAAEAAFGRLGIITGPETGRCRGVGHAGPESGRGHRRTGSRLGLLRQDVPAPGNRQFPCHGGAARSLASGAHLGLSGGRPAPGLHRRPGADRPPTGQAQVGKGRTSTPRSVSSGPRLQRSGPHEGRGPEVVPAVGLNMGLRHHPQEAAGGLPGGAFQAGKRRPVGDVTEGVMRAFWWCQG